jgi:putative spermidine/putrescine transport system ATP-binding protein
MQYEIKHIHESIGVTIIYVTHDQSEALTMSNSIAVFNEGIIQQLDAPDALYERPMNSFVAQFISENNRFEGLVTEVKGEFCTVAINSREEAVKALKVNTDVNAKTNLSIRPERVMIEPSDGIADNVFSGRIEELIYLGDHIRVRLTVLGNSEFFVKVPNMYRQATLKVGHTVKVGWNSKDSRELDA